MVIMTAKVSKRKLLTVLGLLVLAAVVLFTCLRSADAPARTAESAPQSGADTNEARIAFLQSFGWEVLEDPVQTQQVRVPENPSEVFLRYNDLQVSQGYDLSAYSGKTLMRYVYQLTNYPSSDGLYFATLLVYEGTIVGGDVASSRHDGVMHGFAMPKAAQTLASAEADSSAASDAALS